MPIGSVIGRLRDAVRARDLTVYLGAGVSVASNVPDWRKLVVTMYFRALADQHKKEEWAAYPNYLYAVAEWHLKHNPDAAEVIAQKIRTYYQADDSFGQCLRQTVYAPYINPDTGEAVPIDAANLRRKNPTLDAVARLCEQLLVPRHGVRAVITYNFDDLLETVLEPAKVQFQPIWAAGAETKPKTLPIYHVHGYVPLHGEGGAISDLVFSEEQYHAVAHNPYSWSNLVQIKYMSQSVGLTVGVSLTDRNMRRLLDALSKAPIHYRLYALLQRPQWEPVDEELGEIHQRAMSYQEEFAESGYIRGRGRIESITSLVERAKAFDLEQQTRMLSKMGVVPIWYDEHAEVPQIIRQIIG